MEKKTLGSFLAALRKASGLTQKQLAEKLCVSDKAVSRWERDECAPDLTLIPVIAEIFGITTDELLRGQRKAPEEPVTPYETQKTDKQLRRLVQQAQTNFRIRSIISVAVAIAGLIAALICNNGFLRAGIGFFTASVFYVAAAVCQIIFLILSFSAVQTEELDPQALSSYKKECAVFSEIVFTLIILLFAATLPLASVDDAYAGLTSYWWVREGFSYVLVGLIICLAVCFFVHTRMGWIRLPDLHKPINRLRAGFALWLGAVLLVTILIHGSVYGYLYENMHLYAPGTRFDTWEELKEFLETPLSSEGEEMTLIDSYPAMSPDGQVTIEEYVAPDGIIYHTCPFVLSYEQDGETPKYQCFRRNWSVQRFSYSATEDSFPIYTYNSEQLIHADNIHSTINLCICVIYPIELAIGIAIYLKKRKALIK